MLNRAKFVILCKCIDGYNDPDKTGICMNCGCAWELLEGEIEVTPEDMNELNRLARQSAITCRNFGTPFSD